MPYAFETNGAAIYQQSFATIRREAARNDTNWSSLSRGASIVAVRFVFPRALARV